MLTTQTNVVRFTIVQSITAYDFSFPFWDFSQIVVRVSNETGEPVELTRDVDYTITVSEPLTDPVYQDGTVDMISDAFKGYGVLIISRELPLTQDTNYKNSEPINADTLETSLDKATAQIQQIAEEVGHSLKLPITDEAGDYTIPETSQRAGKVIGFNGTGEALKVYSNPDDALEAATAANQQSQSILTQMQQSLQDMQALVAQAEQILVQMQGMMHPGYRQKLGDGATTTFMVTHNLGSEWVYVQLWYDNPATAGYWKCDEIDKNNLSITFNNPPAEDSVEIRIISAERVEIPSDLPDDFEVGPENISSDLVMSPEEIAEIIGSGNS